MVMRPLNSCTQVVARELGCLDHTWKEPAGQDRLSDAHGSAFFEPPSNLCIWVVREAHDLAHYRKTPWRRWMMCLTLGGRQLELAGDLVADLVDQRR